MSNNKYIEAPKHLGGTSSAWAYLSVLFLMTRAAVVAVKALVIELIRVSVWLVTGSWVSRSSTP